jgi:hypothetical protein
MRVAMIVVTMVVATTPLEASQSCMSKTEARHHFGSAHIYWHGPDHCWDATPARRHRIQAVRRRTPTDEVQRKPDPPRAEQSKPEQSGLDQPNWRNSMSAMLGDAAPLPRTPPETRLDGNGERAPSPPAVDRGTSVEPSPVAARWVDIAQVAPPHIFESRPAPPDATGGGGVVLIAFVLAVGATAFLFFIPIYRRRRSTTDIFDTPIDET